MPEVGATPNLGTERAHAGIYGNVALSYGDCRAVLIVPSVSLSSSVGLGALPAHNVAIAKHDRSR
ncbi:MAG: hypothetical protein AAF400_01495 [Bacteroidota bacterium]